MTLLRPVTKPLRISGPDEFWAGVDRTVTEAGCALWRGGLVGGQWHLTLRVEGRTMPAWAYAYELTHGPIAPEMLVYRRCPVPQCVEPGHYELEYDPQRIGAVVGRMVKSHCVHGHPLAGANLLIRHTGGWYYRACRACMRAERLRHARVCAKAERKPKPDPGVLLAALESQSKRAIAREYGVSVACVNRWACDAKQAVWSLGDIERRHAWE